MADDDYPATTGTTGTVTVGGSATGEIGTAGDRDWFAVELEAGRRYTIDLEGSETGDGTLTDPYLRDIHDSNGNRIAGTTNDDGGAGYNSRLTFTATDAGIYYVAAGAYGTRTGTYTLSVTEVPDDYTAGTRTTGAVSVGGSATGEIETARDRDWFAVELEAGETYVIDLEGLDSGGGTLDSTVLRGVYDAEGQRIAGTRTGRGGEGDDARLVFTATETGTHYIAVRGAGRATGTYTVRLDAWQERDAGEAPVFGQERYAFDLAEHADGALFGIAVGPVAASDADNDPITYSIVGGDPDGLFEIDAETGLVVYVGTGEDYESGPTRYELTVRASDGGQHNDVTVTVRVTDVEEYAILVQEADEWPAFVPAGYASDLGDITRQTTRESEPLNLHGTDGEVVYRRFTLTEEKAVALELAGLDADADLVLQDEQGNELHASRESGTTDETLTAILAAGSYYVRVEARESGANAFELRYDVSEVEVLPPSTIIYAPEELVALGLSSSSDDYSQAVGQAGAVVVGPFGAVTGTIETAGDRDWFAVTFVAGTPYLIALEGVETGQGTLSDPYLRGIFRMDGGDQDGNLVPGTGDDNGGRGLNAEVIYAATEAGVFYIAAGAAGSSTGTYRLKVEALSDDYLALTTTTGTVTAGGNVTGNIQFPGDRDWFAVALEAGKVYRADLEGSPTGQGTLGDPLIYGIFDANGNRIANTLNDDGSGYDSRVTFVAPSAATYYVSAGGFRSTSTGTYKLSVTVVTDDYSADTATTATVMVGSSLSGGLDYAGDRDWIAVQLAADKTYRIDVKGDTAGDYGGTLLNPSLRMYNASGNAISAAADDNSGLGLNARLSAFAPGVAGKYFIEVADPGGLGTYTVAVNVVAADSDDDYSESVVGAGAVTVNDVVTGNIETAGDRDWFAVNFVAGKSYRIQLEGSRTGVGTLNDPHLYGIFRTDGGDQGDSLIPNTSNDNSGSGLNAEVAYTATGSGVFYIVAGAAGSSTGTYRLKVRELGDDYSADTATSGEVDVGRSVTGVIQFWGDRDWFAVELEANTLYQIDLIQGLPNLQGILHDPLIHGIHDANGDLIANTRGEGGGFGFDSRVAFVAPDDGTYYVAAGGFRNTSAGAYKLSVTAIVDDYSADTATTATVAVAGSSTGELDYDGDRDWFAVVLEADTFYRIDVKGDTVGDRGGTLHNPSLRLYDATGSAISAAADDNSGVGLNARLSGFEPAAAGKYFIEVADPGGLGTYTVAVEEVTYSI